MCAHVPCGGGDGGDGREAEPTPWGSVLTVPLRLSLQLRAQLVSLALLGCLQAGLELQLERPQLAPTCLPASRQRRGLCAHCCTSRLLDLKARALHRSGARAGRAPDGGSCPEPPSSQLLPTGSRSLCRRQGTQDSREHRLNTPWRWQIILFPSGHIRSTLPQSMQGACSQGGPQIPRLHEPIRRRFTEWLTAMGAEGHKQVAGHVQREVGDESEGNREDMLRGMLLGAAAGTAPRCDTAAAVLGIRRHRGIRLAAAAVL